MSLERLRSHVRLLPMSLDQTCYPCPRTHTRKTTHSAGIRPGREASHYSLAPLRAGVARRAGRRPPTIRGCRGPERLAGGAPRRRRRGAVIGWRDSLGEDALQLVALERLTLTQRRGETLEAPALA